MLEFLVVLVVGGFNGFWERIIGPGILAAFFCKDIMMVVGYLSLARGTDWC
jgi:uncharacterized membrane protein YczE